MTERRFYTPMSLGEKRHMTREGFLVCMDVKMARLATLDTPMLYGPRETPVPPGIDGITRIVRDADELFSEDSILSMVGKPVTNDHPPINVTPDTWNKLSVGHVISARRGEGDDAAYVVGDIMIMDKRAITDVLSGKRELSPGYDAMYDEIGPGVGRQRNITYNHLALVDKGRCGSACSIGDYQPKELRMNWMNKLKAAFHTQDEEAFNEALKEKDDVLKTGNGDVHIHVGGGGSSGTSKDDETDPAAAAAAAAGEGEGAAADPIEQRFQSIEAAIQQIAAAVEKISNAGQEEEAAAEEIAQEAPENIDMKTVKDSAPLAASFQETVATAEIIVPGITLPTFDSAAKPGTTFNAICDLRRRTIDAAAMIPGTMDMLKTLTGGRKLDTKCMTCDAIRTLFRSLGGMRRAMNNTYTPAASAVAQAQSTQDNGKLGLGVTPSAINEAIRKRREAARKSA